MNISKNVIRDLLPVYVAGEASAETRALVAEACAADAELRAEVDSLGAVGIPEAAPPAGLGLASLRRTQALLRTRTFLVGFCYFFTTLPLALIDRPFGAARVLATLCLAVALGGWIAFLRNAKSLRATGLEPARSRWPIVAWQFGGWLIATSTAAVVSDWLGKDFLAAPSYLVLFLICSSIVMLGRRLRQFREPEEIFRTETLFTLARERDEEK